MAMLRSPCREQVYRRNNINGTHWLVKLYFRKTTEIEAMNSSRYLLIHILCSINDKNNILLIIRHCPPFQIMTMRVFRIKSPFISKWCIIDFVLCIVIVMDSDGNITHQRKNKYACLYAPKNRVGLVKNIN